VRLDLFVKLKYTADDPSFPQLAADMEVKLQKFVLTDSGRFIGGGDLSNFFQQVAFSRVKRA